MNKVRYKQNTNEVQTILVLFFYKVERQVYVDINGLRVLFEIINFINVLRVKEIDFHRNILILNWYSNFIFAINF